MFHLGEGKGYGSLVGKSLPRELIVCFESRSSDSQKGPTPSRVPTTGKDDCIQAGSTIFFQFASISPAASTRPKYGLHSRLFLPIATDRFCKQVWEYGTAKQRRRTASLVSSWQGEREPSGEPVKRPKTFCDLK